MTSYDQWKTASPYDDEPDYIEDAEKWINRKKPSEKAGTLHHYEREPYYIIEGLLKIMQDEGIY